MLKEACSNNDNVRINEILSGISGVPNIHNDIMASINNYDVDRFRNLIHTVYINNVYLSYLKNVLGIISALKIANADFKHEDEVMEMKRLLEDLLPTKTDEFSFVLGMDMSRNPFDNLTDEYISKYFRALTEKYIEIATKVYKENGIYVSAIISPVRVAYHTECGCPAQGEICFEIKGTRNVEFIKSSEDFKAAVYKIVNLLREFYNQNTVTLRFSEVHMDYIVKRSDK